MKIEQLVIVLGSQRAGKSLFMSNLGRFKKLRTRYLPPAYVNFTWVVPQNDKMCSETLLSSEYVDDWLARYSYTPFLICHAVRWQQYSSNANLPSLKLLIAEAKNVLVVLIYPPYQQLFKRVMRRRPEAISTATRSEREYIACYESLQQCCRRKGWGFRVVVDASKPC